MTGRFVVNALAAAVLASATAPAADAARLQAVQLAIEITGVQVTDWQYASLEWPAGDRMWDRGSGTQTLGWSTPRPLRMVATRSDGSFGLPRFLGGGISRQPTFRTSLRRTSRWERRMPPPACEGCGTQPWTTRALPQRCGGVRRPSMTVESLSHETRANALELRLRVETWPPFYRECAPDSGAVREIAVLMDQPQMSVPGFARAERLRRGGRLTLRGEWESRPGCRLPDPIRREILDRCTTGSVTLEITRVK